MKPKKVGKAEDTDFGWKHLKLHNLFVQIPNLSRHRWLMELSPRTSHLRWVFVTPTSVDLTTQCIACALAVWCLPAQRLLSHGVVDGFCQWRISLEFPRPKRCYIWFQGVARYEKKIRIMSDPCWNHRVAPKNLDGFAHTFVFKLLDECIQPPKNKNIK